MDTERNTARDSVQENAILLEPGKKVKNSVCINCAETFICKTAIKQFRKFKNKNDILKENEDIACSFCCKTLNNKDEYKFHLKNFHNLNDEYKFFYSTLKENGFLCKFCQNKFLYKKNLNRHMQQCCGKGAIICRICNITFKQIEGLNKHNKVNHNLRSKLFFKNTDFLPDTKQSKDARRRVNSSSYLQNAPLVEYICPHPINISEIEIFFSKYLEKEIENIILYELQNSLNSIKISFFSDIIGKRISEEGENITSLFLNTKSFLVNSPEELKELLKIIIHSFFQELFSLSNNIGSGVSLDFVSNITLQVRKILPKLAGCQNVKFPQNLGGVLNSFGGEKDSCLTDSINIGINYNLYNNIHSHNLSRKCKLKICTPKKLCKNCLQKLKIKNSNVKNYPKPDHDSILNKIEKPSSLKDLLKIEKEYPDYKFLVFDVVDKHIKKPIQHLLKIVKLKNSYH